MRCRSVGIAALFLLIAGCGGGEGAGASTSAGPTTSGEPVTITLLTHDSFLLSDGTLEAFTAETGIDVEVLAGGDAGVAVNQAIVTRDNPIADVLFGVDNTLLTRALDADLFLPYESAAIDGVPAALQLDPEHRVTPIDYGDVCVNYDVAALAAAGVEPPGTLDDLVDPAYRGMLVVQDPATSSPGLAFLLATIARYGDGGWQDWWAQLAGQRRAGHVGLGGGVQRGVHRHQRHRRPAPGGVVRQLATGRGLLRRDAANRAAHRVDDRRLLPSGRVRRDPGRHRARAGGTTARSTSC